MAQPYTSMSKAAVAEGEAGRVAAITDVDSAARYFAKGAETSKPADDSTATGAGAAAGDEDPENPDDPQNPDGGTAAGDPAAAVIDEEDPMKAPEAKDWPESARHRVGEITAKRREAERRATTAEETARTQAERIAELERQVAGKAPTVIAPTAENPLAHIEDPQALQRELDQALSMRDWAYANPEGGTIDLGDGKTMEVSAEEVRTALATTDRMLNQHIPQRMRYLQDRQQYLARAREEYPELLRPGTEDHATYQTLLSHWPELKRFVDPEIIVGRYLRGLKAEEAEKAAKAGKTGTGKGGAAAPAKKPATAIAPGTPRQPAASAPTGAAGGNDAEASAARKKANATGTVDDVARFFSTSRKAA
jgi:hypothetical protein